jgi:hypothetical protein
MSGQLDRHPRRPRMQLVADFLTAAGTLTLLGLEAFIEAEAGNATLTDLRCARPWAAASNDSFAPSRGRPDARIDGYRALAAAGIGGGRRPSGDVGLPVRTPERGERGPWGGR